VNGTVLYAYDEAGRLLGEYDANGGLIEETVWLGDIPVATLRPNGSTISIYYVHSDALNTPRQITRPSDNTAMWTWNSDPFGTMPRTPIRPERAPSPTICDFLVRCLMGNQDCIRTTSEISTQPSAGMSRAIP